MGSGLPGPKQRGSSRPLGTAARRVFLRQISVHDRLHSDLSRRLAHPRQARAAQSMSATHKKQGPQEAMCHWLSRLTTNSIYVRLKAKVLSYGDSKVTILGNRGSPHVSDGPSPVPRPRGRRIIISRAWLWISLTLDLVAHFKTWFDSTPIVSLLQSVINRYASSAYLTNLSQA